MILWASLRRLLHIIRVLARHGVAAFLGERVERWGVLSRRLPRGVLSGPERFRTILEDLGGTFIKFGQMLALQPDIITVEYCNALFKLLDQVDPFPWEDVERIFREELGHGPLEIFDDVVRIPLATASIGQVHTAYLGERKLAIKVQRPTVESDFAGDIRLMVTAISLVQRLHIRSLAWVVEPLSEFVHWTREELDYRNEARYMMQLRRNARDNEWEQVPAVLEEYTTPRILVCDYLEGPTALDCLRAQEAGDQTVFRRLAEESISLDDFSRHVIDNFLGDAFRHGMFHADLHPANLMIRPRGAVGYIDFGITGVLSAFSRRHLISMTLAYTAGDIDGMCASFFEVSRLDDDGDPDGFRQALRALSPDWYERRGTELLLRKNFTLVMLDMLRLSRSYGVWPERDVIKYIRSSIAIDGLITRLAPSFDLAGHLQKACNSLVRIEARRALTSREGLLGWTLASGHLLDDAALRLSNLLDKTLQGELPIKVETHVGRRQTADRLRRRALLSAATVLVVAIVMAFGIGPSGVGVTLLAAQGLIAAGALLVLVRTLTRMA